MSVKVVIICCISFLLPVFAFKPRIFGNSKTAVPSEAFLFKSSLSNDIVPSLDEVDSLRKWYTLTSRKRAEVFISDASTVPTIVADIWKAILVSFRVLESDQTNLDNLILRAYPKYIIDANNADAEIERFKTIAALIAEDYSSLLFQPNNFKRTIDVQLKPPLDDGSPASLAIIVGTRRTSPAIADFDDIDDYVPDVENALTNDIESFPFPSVYDFVSEINRPADPLTLSELSFDYNVTDFKFDLVQMAKKRDPQEFVKSINCKLTRLQKWRDVLSQPDKNDIADPFTNVGDWQDSVKLKYQSMKAMAMNNTKKALDTQYDKRATYINIIDQWSDRLKRSFKCTYFASNREQEDFRKAILDSKWLNDVLNSTKLLAKTPFLDFSGPDFTPGVPSPLFRDDRYVMYNSGYPAQEILYEMLAWFNAMAPVQHLAGISAFGDIVQHTYSRGLVTERVMYDVWQGLCAFIADIAAVKSPALNAAELYEGLSQKSKQNAIHTSHKSMDHMDSFLTSLRDINKIARDASIAESSGVKQLFKVNYEIGRELGEWWSNIAREFDLMDELEEKSIGRSTLWSEIMDKVMAEENMRELRGSDGRLDAASSTKLAEENTALWKDRYKKVMQFSELIESALPWRNETLLLETPSESGLSRFARQVYLRNETVTLDFTRDSSNGDPSYLFIAPRFFRGIGGNEELVRPHLNQAVLSIVALRPTRMHIHNPHFSIILLFPSNRVLFKSSRNW